MKHGGRISSGRRLASLDGEAWDGWDAGIFGGLGVHPLEAVLQECPQVEIVISSTWREARTLVQLQSMFSADIGARIVGVTPMWQDVQDEMSMGTYVRQAEIEAWLRQAGRTWEPWIALDDQPWLFRPFLPNLVRSDPATGLTEAVCTMLRTKLQGG